MAIRLALALGLAVAAAAGLDCASCHREIADSFALTAHANTSQLASADSILGPFTDGPNRLNTRTPGVYFRMQRREDGFYQTGIQGDRARTERFDIVIGSGRRGQSYLYWRDGLLFQLPVSYHASGGRWIHSPGYEEGAVHFDRLIPPQCLACHTTRFRIERSGAQVRYGREMALGIGCAGCHGAADDHRRIRRTAGIELCARCHSGLEEEKSPEPDVHGNQVGLLKMSRCYQASQEMTCVTCHDVHRVERDPAALAARCAACHQAQACPRVSTGHAARSGCVDCHMPVLPSRLIEVQSYRTHRIAVYRK